MLIALLAVNLIVIVVLLVLVGRRNRWVKCQPGTFAGRIRTADGEFEGLGAKWKRGYGRWVRNVLVWNKAPLLLRNEFVPIDGLASERSAAPEDIKRLGDSPVVIELTAGGATIEVAASGEDRDRLCGPYESSGSFASIHWTRCA